MNGRTCRNQEMVPAYFGQWSEKSLPRFQKGAASSAPSNINRPWVRVRRRAQAFGVRPLRLHHARHTWATFALLSWKNIRWVSEQLGHADPAFTLRVYAHVLREDEVDLSFADFSSAGRPDPSFWTLRNRLYIEKLHTSSVASSCWDICLNLDNGAKLSLNVSKYSSRRTYGRS